VLSALFFISGLSLRMELYAGEKLSAETIIQKSQQAFYYAGADVKIRVSMKLINREGKERLRELTMTRKNYDKGRQKYFTYFHNPSDVRGTTFMVWKEPEENDSRWLFIPAIKLVTRISARDSRSSFVGSDFTYEDISGRNPEADAHTLVREEKVEGKDCYVLESIPGSEADFARKTVWIDSATFLPLKEEYYDLRGELYKVFTAAETKNAGGFWTVTKRTMKDIKRGHRTEVTFDEIKYNTGVSDSLFTERYLRRPPQ
ncbi:MAG TPA: outer membrane lipoprotein-sorting protein, partial [bacterium]|nr:outer membrane lipoprotein-sorting protein [bacterium]